MSGAGVIDFGANSWMKANTRPSHFTERPAIFHHGRIAEAMQAPRPGETREETWERFMRDWGAMQQSPFFTVWAFAAIDEMLSALYERIIGSKR